MVHVVRPIFRPLGWKWRYLGVEGTTSEGAVEFLERRDIAHKAVFSPWLEVGCEKIFRIGDFVDHKSPAAVTSSQDYYSSLRTSKS